MLKTPTMIRVKARAPTVAQRVASNQLLRGNASNLPPAIRGVAAALNRMATPITAAGPGNVTHRAPVTAKVSPPITNGAMPRKLWVSPKVAVPPRARATGAAAKIPSVFDRLTRGRVQQRATR